VEGDESETPFLGSHLLATDEKLMEGGSPVQEANGRSASDAMEGVEERKHVEGEGEEEVNYAKSHADERKKAALRDEKPAPLRMPSTSAIVAALEGIDRQEATAGQMGGEAVVQAQRHTALEAGDEEEDVSGGGDGDGDGSDGGNVRSSVTFLADREARGVSKRARAKAMRWSGEGSSALEVEVGQKRKACEDADDVARRKRRKGV
jgi:hypothetical protein